jgi:hypothetical protein
MNRRTVKETAGKVMGEIQQNGGTKMKTKIITMINMNYYKITNGRQQGRQQGKVMEREESD